MKTQDITYEDGAERFIGHLVYDETRGGPRPGVLVAPDAMGLGKHAMESGRRIAALGYVAFCLDMYGGRRLMTSPAEMPTLLEPLMKDSPRIRRRAQAGLAVLAALPQVDAARLAAIGYCFGGMTVLEMARAGAALGGVVSFHGVLTTAMPAAVGAVKAKILVLTGADDPLAPAEHVAGLQQELSRAGADWQVVSYSGTQHAFTLPAVDAMNMPGMKYSKRADERSWAAMQSFFGEIFA